MIISNTQYEVMERQWKQCRHTMQINGVLIFYACTHGYGDLMNLAAIYRTFHLNSKENIFFMYLSPKFVTYVEAKQV